MSIQTHTHWISYGIKPLLRWGILLRILEHDVKRVKESPQNVKGFIRALSSWLGESVGLFVNATCMFNIVCLT